VQNWKAYVPIQKLTEDIELNKLQKSTKFKRSGREQQAYLALDQALFFEAKPNWIDSLEPFLELHPTLSGAKGWNIFVQTLFGVHQGSHRMSW